MNIKFEKTGQTTKGIHLGCESDLKNTCVIHTKEFDTLVIVDDDGNHKIYGKPVKVTHNDKIIQIDSLS